MGNAEGHEDGKLVESPEGELVVVLLFLDFLKHENKAEDVGVLSF